MTDYNLGKKKYSILGYGIYSTIITIISYMMELNTFEQIIIAMIVNVTIIGVGIVILTDINISLSVSWACVLILAVFGVFIIFLTPPLQTITTEDFLIMVGLMVFAKLVPALILGGYFLLMGKWEVVKETSGVQVKAKVNKADNTLLYVILGIVISIIILQLLP